MATNPMFFLLPILLSLLVVNFPATGEAAAGTVSTSFIRSSCSATTYPALCVQSLSIYAPAIQKSPSQLVITALNVSLDRSKDAHGFIKKLAKFKGLKHREYEAIKDCLEELSDSVDRLTKSISELKIMGKTRGSDFQWHMSNVETWISSALTDGSTCFDGFSGRGMDGRIKYSIRTRVTHVAQVTSNALALVNQFAAKQY